jgi:hypothetical protein
MGISERDIHKLLNSRARIIDVKDESSSPIGIIAHSPLGKDKLPVLLYQQSGDWKYIEFLDLTKIQMTQNAKVKVTELWVGKEYYRINSYKV